MKPAVATIIFYTLLLLGWGILRGSLTPFPTWVDAMLAFVMLAVGLTVWAAGWRSTQPEAPSLDGTRRAARWREWVLWIGLAALTAILFLGPMAWVSTRWARPVQPEGARAAKIESPRPASNADGNERSGPGAGVAGGDGRDSAGSSAGTAESVGLVSRSWASVRAWPRTWQLFAVLAAAAFLILLIWMAIKRSRETSRPQPQSGHVSSAHMPAYLQEFRRLCATWGCAIDAGSTIREAFRRLTESGHIVSSFEPVARYHYRVCYENGPADAGEERRLRRMLRTARRHPGRFRVPTMNGPQ